MSNLPSLNNPHLILIHSGVPESPQTGRYLTFTKEKISIGSDLTDDIQLPVESALPSHALLYEKENQWYLKDLKNSDTVLLEGIIIAQAKIPRLGGLIQIGKAFFKFFLGNGPESLAFQTIYKMLNADPLTQIYNVRYFKENLLRELARCGRTSRPLSLLLLDIDHFKEINDTYGHLAGDAVLIELTKRVNHRVRKNEFFARYGGEEFVILLPDTNAEQAYQCGVQIQQIIQNNDFIFGAHAIKLTISMGIVTTTQELTVEEFLQQADKNLYRAKNSGRNRIVS